MTAGDGAAWRKGCFVPLLVLQIWAAHAVAFFTHEYAHAFAAWALGWKSSPFALYYAKPSIIVLLIQLGINQDVDNTPIFASGHGVDAAVIAGAGMLVGNGLITYPIGRVGLALSDKRGRPGWAMFFFWLTAASIGNFIDYVPIRIFTNGSDDMGVLARGLGWSPWLLLVVLGVPTFIVTVDFFGRITPAAVTRWFPHSLARRYGVAVLSVLFVFGFYGSAGLLEGDPISFRFGLACVCVVAPAMAAAVMFLVRRSAARASIAS